MEIQLRDMRKEDQTACLKIFNEIIEEGGSFPFPDPYTKEEFDQFCKGMTLCRVLTEGKKILGFYVLGPNIPGRCSSIANASYAVDQNERGKHYGEKLVMDSLEEAKKLGFRMMQFNGVVDSNVHARHLYARCGFREIGVIPKGFQVKDGHYEDMHIMLNVFSC
jgi:L-amino acid N-acyltransferase YncA